MVKKRADATSPSTKEKRTEPSSNRPFKYLSPNSQTACLSKNVKERHRMKKCLVKIDEEDEIELKGEQKKEVEKLTALIEEKHQGDLEAVFDEASKEQEGVGEMLREVWEYDVKGRSDFYDDQLKNSKHMYDTCMYLYNYVCIQIMYN